jgi:hypothetical protein
MAASEKEKAKARRIYHRIHSGRLTKGEIASFKRHIYKTRGCWIWLGAREKEATRRKKGYGKFGGNRACRVAYLIFKGRMPKKRFVLHTCDNKLCVNPRHLWLGTIRQNSKDMMKKNRQAKWFQYKHTKLEPRYIEYIREMGRQGFPHSEIARQFGVHKSNIQKIIAGKAWQCVRNRRFK